MSIDPVHRYFGSFPVSDIAADKKDTLNTVRLVRPYNLPGPQRFCHNDRLIVTVEPKKLKCHM